MIVIGAETHKRTHALAAVDADTGQLLGEREIAATEQGHLDGLRWARELGHEITWAVEDCRHVPQRFERSLVSACCASPRSATRLCVCRPKGVVGRARARAKAIFVRLGSRASASEQTPGQPRNAQSP